MKNINKMENTRIYLECPIYNSKNTVPISYGYPSPKAVDKIIKLLKL